MTFTLSDEPNRELETAIEVQKHQKKSYSECPRWDFNIYTTNSMCLKFFFTQATAVGFCHKISCTTEFDFYNKNSKYFRCIGLAIHEKYFWVTPTTCGNWTLFVEQDREFRS